MLKRATLAVAAVFVLWSVLDLVIHGLLLQSTYEATAHLWRPMEEMKMGLMRVVTLVYAGCFVAIYSLLIAPKSLVSGLKFGGLFGLAAGLSMGFGSYSYLPIPATLAWTWFLGALIEAVAAGAVVGAILPLELPF